MTLRIALATLIRIVGLYLLITNVINLLLLIYISARQHGMTPELYLGYVPTIAVCILAYAMSFCSLRIVDSLAPGTQTSVPEAEQTKAQDLGVDLPLLGVKLLGLYFIVNAATSVDQFVQAYHALVSAATGGVSVSDYLIRYIAPILVQLAAGIWLLLGGSGIIHLIRQARRVGT